MNEKHLMRVLCHCLAVGVVVGSFAAAARADEKPAKAKPAITRADLGVAYLRLDHAFTAHKPDDAERVAQINQDFDKATLAFFGGQYANTLRTIDRTSAELLYAGKPVAALAAMALKAEVSPPIVVAQETSSVALAVRSLYDPQIETDAELSIEVLGADQKPLFAAPLKVAADKAGRRREFDLTNIVTKLPPGVYPIQARGGDMVIALSRAVVVPRSLDAIRAENSVELDKVEASTPALTAALAACRDRNALLTDQPSTEQSSQFMADPLQLVTQVKEEIAALAAGRDPYSQRAGDYWRTAAVDEKPIPMRVYAPERVAKSTGAPLVVALHGAGGDENMFFEGYGAGRLKNLADEHGLLVVSPSTYIVTARPNAFDAVMAAVGHNYRIDPKRVYLIGHSMGAGASSQLAAARAEAITAACCLAGGGRSKAVRMSPTLLIAAKLDLVVPAARLEQGAKRGIEAGLPIEFRMMENYGHTLMVGESLVDALAWLLKHPATP